MSSGGGNMMARECNFAFQSDLFNHRGPGFTVRGVGCLLLHTHYYICTEIKVHGLDIYSSRSTLAGTIVPICTPSHGHQTLPSA